MMQPSLDALDKQLENLQTVLIQIKMAETDAKVLLA